MTSLNLKEVTKGFINPGKPFPEEASILDQLSWVDEACEFGSSDRKNPLRTALKVAIEELRK